MKTRPITAILGVISILLLPNVQAQEPAKEQPCSVLVVGKQITLQSPAFAFTIDTSDGLRGVSWQNRLTGRTLSLGNGSELGLDIGLPDQPLTTPTLRVTAPPTIKEGMQGEVSIELAGDDPQLTATVRYCWDARQAVLRKFATITNRSGQPWDRLLNVRLGDYATDAGSESGDPDYPAQLETRIDDLTSRTRGLPAYIQWQFYVGLAHPAGFATGQDGQFSLRQLPGIKLAAGECFECMEAVYGVSREGQARKAFCDHLLTRMRRTLRGHDKPLAIFEPFGAKPDGDFWETEAFVVDNLARVVDGQRDSGLHWDYYSIDFWHDPAGDLKTPDKSRFPNGFTKILPELSRIGTLPGLWVDSGNVGDWTIVENPAVARALTPARGRTGFGLCRATEPANRFYIEGYQHQLRENGVRLVKFDNAQLTCSNPDHEHLPGEYSVEPIENALIDFYRSLDRESSDVFIMLYWDYRSPWWLQYADTVFDVGMHMEGASFAPYPTLRARDSVTRRLDRGRWMLKDWPALGWDTLGIWLSDWPWNSRIGKQAWEGGVIMDISRGHLLAQIWSDTAYLTPGERRQMADFIALLKAHPDCFRDSRFILGNPWQDEPYGYCCSDGQRAFLAINNGVWHDSTITLDLNSAWGLPDDQRWNIYRWWPNPARLAGEHGAQATVALRPFEIVLLEVVPAGQAPSLDRQFQSQELPTRFAEASQELTITVEKPDESREITTIEWSPLEVTDWHSTGGATLTKLPDGSLLASGDNPARDSYVVKTRSALRGITAIRLETLTDDSLPYKGPGRAINGNFTLSELRLFVAGQQIPIARAGADFSQSSHGGWPVAAAIDGQPHTGWGIDPAEGANHFAIFELAQPLSFPPDSLVEIRLDHTDRQHSIGRLRLAVTAMEAPIPMPQSEIRVTVRGTVPPTKTGGVLALSDAFFLQSNPYWTLFCKDGFSITAAVGGRAVPLESVINNGMYSAPWQTWWLPLAPADTPTSFELQISSSLPSEVEHRFSAHFIPGDQAVPGE